MTNKIYAKFNDDGTVIGFWQSAAYDEPEKVIRSDAIEITPEQFDDLFEYQGLRRWDGSKIVVYTPPPPPVTSVSRRQFKMQLAIAGLLEQVEAWVAAQDPLTKIAYAESGTFLRNDAMMSEGFSAMGFTEEEVDEFFGAAAKL